MAEKVRGKKKKKEEKIPTLLAHSVGPSCNTLAVGSVRNTSPAVCMLSEPLVIIKLSDPHKFKKLMLALFDPHI